MKYVILLGDGMADEPMAELDGQTPLERAQTPNMDALARRSEQGLVHTVPAGFSPGSDVANLSVFGYDPATCYSGRSPLEAASMGVQLAAADVAFRLNLVHLAPHYGKIYMEDFSAGHISTPEASSIIETLQAELGGGEFNFYPGVSYRHLMVWRGGKDRLSFTPPHDITHQGIEGYLPRGDGAEELIALTTTAQMILKNHPVNRRREQAGQLTANSIWLWGHGRAPRMETLTERYGLTGSVISAVDLIKGIGIYAGLKVVNVPGATGYIDTNYLGKAEAALAALREDDFVYLHVEAPDEAAHSGNLADKIKAIEDFDSLVVGTVLAGLPALGAHRVLLLPDHPTPVAKMTHTDAPVPYLLFDSGHAVAGRAGYSERQAEASGRVIPSGRELFSRLISGT